MDNPPRTIVETEDGRFYEVEPRRGNDKHYLAWPVYRPEPDGFTARNEEHGRIIPRAHTRIVSPTQSES